MIKITAFLISVFYTSVVTIYSFTVTTVTGTTIHLNDYQNKKIILVNIATSGTEVSQLQELELFYQKHKDSILVLGFASNSFNNTSQTGVGLSTFLSSRGITFPVVGRTEVTGSSAHPIYKWVEATNENGYTNVEVEEDFQKILISKQGKVSGVFSSALRPGSAFIANALRVN